MRVILYTTMGLSTPSPPCQHHHGNTTSALPTPPRPCQHHLRLVTTTTAPRPCHHHHGLINTTTTTTSTSLTTSVPPSPTPQHHLNIIFSASTSLTITSTPLATTTKADTQSMRGVSFKGCDKISCETDQDPDFTRSVATSGVNKQDHTRRIPVRREARIECLQFTAVLR